MRVADAHHASSELAHLDTPKSLIGETIFGLDCSAELLPIGGRK